MILPTSMDYREGSTFIGSLKRTWGHNGELMADLRVHQPSDLLPSGWLFVELEGQLVPFRYSSIRETTKQGVLILFDGYESPEEASILQGKSLYAPDKTVVHVKRSAMSEDEMIGLKVRDVHYGHIGSVIRVEGSTTQDVLVILSGVKEVLVPVVEDIILEFDPDARELIVATPPGLIDMYLG